MTDLSGKFAALSDALTGRLDTVIARLDTLITNTEPSTEIVDAITALRGASPNNTIKDLYTSLGIVQGRMLGPDGASLGEMIENIAQVLGAAPYGDMELSSIKSWLYALLQSSQLTGVIPDSGSIGGSTTNNGTYSTGGVRYILWGNVEGLTTGSNGYELTPWFSWEGYRVYVQTDAPEVHLYDITDSGESVDIPANSWYVLTAFDGDTLAFAVDSNYTATAYMYVPYQNGLYYWAVSDTQGVNVPGYGMRYMWNTTKYPGLSYVASPPNPRVLFGNWAGWRWEATGTGIFVSFGENATSSYTESLEGTFPNNVHYILVQATSPGLTIKLLGPGPS